MTTCLIRQKQKCSAHFKCSKYIYLKYTINWSCPLSINVIIRCRLVEHGGTLRRLRNQCRQITRRLKIRTWKPPDSLKRLRTERCRFVWFKVHLYSAKANFFFDLCHCSMWKLNWIFREPICKSTFTPILSNPCHVLSTEQVTFSCFEISRTLLGISILVYVICI